MKNISKNKRFYVPEEKVSLKKKLKEDWYIPAVNFYIDFAISNNDKSNLKAYHKLMLGEINLKDKRYKYILNPLNFDDSDKKNYPGNLQNYDIISPIVMRYLGEYIKMPKNFVVTCINNDIETVRKEQENYEIEKLIVEAFKTELKKQGLPVEADENFNIEEKYKDFSENWDDNRSIEGQKILDYIRFRTDSDYIYTKCYYDWLVYGEFYTYRDVYRDTIIKEHVNVFEAYPISSSRDFVEDEDGFVRKVYMSIHKIIDRFRSDITSKELDYLLSLRDKSINSNGAITTDYTLFKNSVSDYYWDFVKDDVANGEFKLSDDYSLPVYHVMFKTLKPIKILTYLNGLGEEIQTEVNEDYKLNEEAGDIKLETEWINTIMECWRIGDYPYCIYIKPREVLVQRQEVNNSSACKLLYGGKKRLFPFMPNHSIVKTLEPYQILYNIIHLQRERAIAKNQGRIMIIPKGIISDDDEISQIEAIYFMQADGKLYVDESADNFALAVQALKQVDMSDAGYINDLTNILISIKEEAWESVAMNRQRFGQSYASDGKFTTEQAIIRASVGTVPITEIFNKAIEKDYEADLDTAKYAWVEVDGVKQLGSYINSEGNRAILSIVPKDFINSDLAVYVKNSAVEQEKIDEFRRLAFSAAQNGELEMAVEALDSADIGKLKNIIRRYNNAKRKAESKRLQSEQQIKQQEVQLELQKLHDKIKSDENITLIKEEGANTRKMLDVEIARLKYLESIGKEKEANEVRNNIEKLKLDLQAKKHEDNMEMKNKQLLLSNSESAQEGGA